MGLKNFNKIINIEFLDASGVTKSVIKTPTNGRKPNITITGMFLGDDLPQRLNVTIKNFYFSAVSKDFEKIKITAGYAEKSSVILTGIIAYMYQENVGPESQVVISCNVDKGYAEWMNKNVVLSYTTSYKLSEILQKISTALGYTKAPIIQTDKELQEPFQFTGSCRDALNQIKTRFNLIILNTGAQLKAQETGKTTGLVVNEIPILSSPPVIKSGAGNTANSIMIVAPWNPTLKVGDIVKVSLKVYKTALLVKNVTDSATVQILSLQFNFSTVATANQMTIEGLVIE